MNSISSKRKSLLSMHLKVKNFITHGIWSQSLNNLSPLRAGFMRLLRVVLLALRGYKEDKVILRASALTYFTLMSIVPILAMGFGIAKGFGMDKYLEEQLREGFQGQEAIVSQLINFSNSLLQRTGGGLIAGIGVIVLFYSVLSIFTQIENSFNDIWRITAGRTWVRKFTDYLSMMLVAPVLMIASSGVTVFISTQISSLSEKSDLLSMLGPYLMVLLQFAPTFILWILFTIIYIVMPNTKVNIKSGIISGIIAGTVFSIVQWAYVDLQVGVSRYNAIYGSFAALPLFLVWLQISWSIVLIGAEISFAHQNQNLFEFETETENISHHSNRIISLLVLNRIIKQFVAGEPALTALEISNELRLPIRLIGTVLRNLVDCRIVSITFTNNSKKETFQPAQYVDKFTISYVMNALDKQGVVLEPDNPEMVKVIQFHKSFAEKIEQLPENILVKEL